MALLYMSGHSDGPLWEACLAPRFPGLDFRIHPDSGPPEDIDAALVWNHPLDELARFPRLRLVMSLGAGVDHILTSRHLVPDGVALTRIVDPAMTAQMTGWCILVMLDHLRRMEDYRQLHRERRYEELEVPLPRGRHGRHPGTRSAWRRTVPASLLHWGTGSGDGAGHRVTLTA